MFTQSDSRGRDAGAEYQRPSQVAGVKGQNSGKEPFQIANNGPINRRTAQLQRISNGVAVMEPSQSGQGGLPSALKSGIEGLSGLNMGDVRVHYNSDKPAQLQAHAFAQGSDIHLASGQERHLPHEAWHVVQQKQGRVKPTLQLKGIAINDDTALEREADEMGARAASGSAYSTLQLRAVQAGHVAQRVGFTVGDKKRDTKDLTLADFQSLIRSLDLKLDENSLASLATALENAGDDAQMKISKDEREVLAAHVRHVIAEMREMIPLLQVEEKANLVKLRDAGVDEKTVAEKFRKTIARQDWSTALGNLELLATAVPNAQMVNKMKKKLLDAKLLEREGGAQSDAKQNLAGASLEIAGQQGTIDLWSISGYSGNAMQAPQFGAQEADLQAMWGHWTNVSAGRYHGRAKAFFSGNTKDLDHERSMDSEVQLLDTYLNNLLQGVQGNDDLKDDAKFNAAFPAAERRKVLGSLVVHSDRTPCLSCGTMLDLFRKDFPGITVMVTYSRAYGELAGDDDLDTIQAGDEKFIYKTYDHPPRSEARSTDAEHAEVLKRRQREIEEKERIRKEQEAKARAMKMNAKNQKFTQAEKDLAGMNLKADELAKMAKYCPVDSANYNTLIKAIMDENNAVAKLQAVKKYLKGFPPA